MHNKFNENAVLFFKAVLSSLLSSELSYSDDEMDHPRKFNRVVIGDSTKFSIPNNMSSDYPSYGGNVKVKALMNIQHSYDILNKKLLDVTIGKATSNDQSYVTRIIETVQTNDLLIYDLGYVTTLFINQIIKKDAYFLNRLPSQWNVYEAQSAKKVDWGLLYKDMKRKKSTTLEMQVHLTKQKIESRMIFNLVSKEVYEKRINLATKRAKSYGNNVSKEYKIRARFDVYITNAKSQDIKKEDVKSIYRLRWQIELIFKVWKSVLKIDMSKKVNKYRFECQLIAKLIWVILTYDIHQAMNNIDRKNGGNGHSSMFKVYKYLRSINHHIRSMVFNNECQVQWLKKFLVPFIMSFEIEIRQRKLPHYQILNLLS